MSNIKVVIHTGDPKRLIWTSPTTFYYPERYLLHPKNQIKWVEDLLRDIYSLDFQKIHHKCFEGNTCYIITNSDHIINRFRVAKKKEEIEQLELLFYQFYNDENYKEPILIKVDKNGTLSKNPDGLLDEWGNQLLNLLK